MTVINGSVASSSAYGGWRARMDMEETDGSTSYTIYVSEVECLAANQSTGYRLTDWSGSTCNVAVKATGQSSSSRTDIQLPDDGVYYWLFSKSMTWAKTHSPQQKTLTATARLVNWRIDSPAGYMKSISDATSTVSYTFTVPALESWTVTLDAQGGTGAASTLTKYYGEALALPQPAKEGYTFAGWADSASPATVVYQPGASYTANAAASLVAVWTPIITSATISQLYAARDDGRFLWDSQTGTHTSASDDGEYVYIRAWWRVDGAATATVSLDAGMADTSTVWTGATRQAAKPGTGELYLEGVAEWGTTQTALATGQYDVTVTLSTGTGNPSDSRGATVSTAFFTIDVLAGGHGIAFGKPATQAGLMDIGLDVGMDGDLDVAGGLSLGAVDYIECRLSANTAAGTTATWTYVDVKLDTESVKYGDALSLATSGTNRYGVVVAKAGWYRLSGYINVNAASYVGVVVGGDVVSNVIFLQSGYNGAGLGSSVRYLSAGSVIKLRIERTGSTDPTIAGTTLTALTVERIG